MTYLLSSIPRIILLISVFLYLLYELFNIYFVVIAYSCPRNVFERRALQEADLKKKVKMPVVVMIYAV